MGKNSYVISKAKFEKALDGSGGILSIIARRLKCQRLTVYRFLERQPEYKKLMEDERDKIIDAAEANLFKQVQEGDKDAIKYVLKTIGRKRGYVERTEQQVNVQVSVADSIIDAFNRRQLNGKNPKQISGVVDVEAIEE